MTGRMCSGGGGGGRQGRGERGNEVRTEKQKREEERGGSQVAGKKGQNSFSLHQMMISHVKDTGGWKDRRKRGERAEEGGERQSLVGERVKQESGADAGREGPRSSGCRCSFCRHLFFPSSLLPAKC